MKRTTSVRAHALCAEILAAACKIKVDGCVCPHKSGKIQAGVCLHK